ncbi:MAG: CDP-alcohol phosphatidyltransferase family protein [Thermodesulfobacteriota bacterium]|nr:CDP-alcohol phosphatidyltransferase family protein [Thermodesulfobacteriota bacterium]
MLSAKIGHRLDPYISKVAGIVINKYISPNLLTLLGFFINVFGAFALAYGRWKIAGGLIIVGGIFDMLDGAFARTYGKVSKFGELFDSVIDRYSDLTLLIGLIIYYANMGNIPFVILTCITSIGTVLVPYTRAKAEIFVPKCNVGLMERAERIGLLVIGALFNVMGIVLWILAILTNVTVFQRLYYTWKKVEQ